MEREKKLELLAEVMDVSPEELSEEMLLAEAGEWDSLARLSYVVMVGDEFGREVTREEVRSLVTVEDALKMME